jgi:autotransporter-associated beta strand protein
MISPAHSQVRRGTSCLAAAFVLAFSASAALAATSTWTGGGAPSVNWSLAANWGGTAPTSSQTTDLVFAGATNVGTSGTPLNNDFTAPMVLDSIAFSSGGGAFFLGGNSIQLNGTAANANTITQNSSSAESIANNFDPTGKTGNNTTTITLAGNGTGVVTLKGNVLAGNGARDYAITKTDTSTFVLSGSNTYGGATAVNGGTLTLDYSTNNNTKLANGAALNLGGGTLNLSGGSHTEVVASTTLNTGASSITRSSGTSVLRMKAITRNAGSTVNFGAASIADTDTDNVNGILGGYATVAGADWAMSATSANNTAITAFTTYTTFVATGGVATTNYLQTDSISLTASESANSLKINTTTTGQSLDIGATRTLTLTSGGLLFVGAQDYQINNGTLKSNTATNSDLIIQQWGAGTLTINSVIANGNGTSTLTKAGTGTLALGGNNTYSGTTFVNAGTLLANNATASTGSGAVIVNNSGTLGGTGKITGSVTLNNSSTIDGGTVGTVGTLSTGALTLNNTSILRVDMTSTTADQIRVTGAVALGTTALLQLDIPNGTLFSAGQAFTLIDNDAADAITGTFSNAAAGTDTINGYGWIVTYTGGDGNDFMITAVPEPSTWLAAALALGVIGFSQRKRVRACARVINERLNRTVQNNR